MTSPELNDPKTGGPANPRRLQFSLRWLLAVPVWLALFFASIAWWGVLGAAMFVFLSCLVILLFVPIAPNVPYPFRRKYLLLALVWAGLHVAVIASPAPLIDICWLLITLWASAVLMITGFALRSIHWFCAGLGLLSMMVLSVAPSISMSGDAAYKSMCNGHLKQLGLALHNYHDRFGCFPPAYVADADGQPLYSWRVLILPFIEQKPLYDAWNFDEPWDSPNNVKLSQTAIDVFLCPSDEQSTSNWQSAISSYLAVVGEETIWPGTESRCFTDVADGTSNTIAIVEVRNSGVHWAEPRDLHVDQMAPTVNPEAGQGISSDHLEGANVLFVDGSVRFLDSALPAKTLRALLTIAGGEDPGSEEF